MPPLESKSRQEWYTFWKKRLSTAKSEHKKHVKDWAEKILIEYAGETDRNLDTTEKYEQVAQVIMAVEETVQPHLFFQNPTVIVSAKRQEYEAREELVAAVINQEYTDFKDSGYGIELENELVVLDARLLPYGVTKTSYEVEGEMLREDIKPQGVMAKISKVLTGEPSFTEQPVITRERGHITERVNPLNLYLDYTATHITKQKWIIEEIPVAKDELRKIRYEQDKIEKLEPSVSIDPEYKNISNIDRQRMMDQDPDARGYRIYEIHDLENRVIHTLAEGLEDFIEFGTEYPMPESSVYSFLWFIEKPNEVYPLPPIKFYRKRANEFSYIYSQVAKQIDRFMPKIGVDGTKLGPEDKEKLKSGNLATIFTTIGPPGGVVSVFNPQVQRDLFEYMGMIKELMNLESGVNEYELSNPEKRKATEARQISEGATARRFKPKKRVRGFLRNQAHKVWMILSQNVTEERMVKVLGKDDAMDWWRDHVTGKSTWTKVDIAGDYWFDIDVDSVTPRDVEKIKEDNMQAFQLIVGSPVGQLMQTENKELMVSPIVEKILKDNLGFKDTSKVIKDLNILDPEQEHDLWMYGQYPPVQEREDLQDHVSKHQAYISSPMFQFMPDLMKTQAAKHLYETRIRFSQSAQAGVVPPQFPSIAKRPPRPDTEIGSEIRQESYAS